MKKWYKSKTIWLQGATAVVGGLEAASVVQVVPHGYEGVLFVTLAVLNAGIRFATKEAIK